MTTPRTYEAVLPVEFSQFFLFDHFSELEPGGIPRGDGLVHAGPGGVRFLAQDRSIRAAVHLKVGEGASPAGSVVAGYFTTPTGRVILCATTGSPNDVVVNLGEPGTYSVQATRTSDELPDEAYRTESWELVVLPTK